MTEEWTDLKQYYYGRQWNAPVADGAKWKDLSGLTCVMCEEEIKEGDDAMLSLQANHTECLIRATLGDIYHLSQTCSCYGGVDHDTRPYRESAKDTINWLVAHKQGSWR